MPCRYVIAGAAGDPRVISQIARASGVCRFVRAFMQSCRG